MAESGQKNLASSGVLYTDRRDFYIRPNIVKELWTDVAPFLTVVANQQTISGMADPTFKMFEHKNPWQKQEIKINDESISEATVSASDTEGTSPAFGESVGIDSPVGIAIGSNLNGLQVEVRSSAGALKGVALLGGYSSNTIKLKNLSDADFEMANDDVLTIIGNAQAEGSTSPEAWSDDLEVVYNSTQIFKTPLQISGTLLQASLRGESSELARLRDQKASEHKIQKERAFLFGENPKGIKAGFGAIEDVTDANGNAIRSTMGIIPALMKHGVSSSSSYEQNIFDNSADNDYEYGDFVDQMEKIFQYVPTSGMRKAFVGAGALGYWSKLGGNAGSFAGNSGWTVNLGDIQRDALGFNYRVLETPHGMLQLIPTPALRGYYNKHMVIVSEENLFHAQYRAPQFQASIQPNDADYVKDQYMSDEGIGISLIESHALMIVPS